MNNELHIQLKPDAAAGLDDFLDGFPYAAGQSLQIVGNGVVMIDMGDAQDTTLEQEWYLNRSEDVASFYVVGDDEEPVP